MFEGTFGCNKNLVKNFPTDCLSNPSAPSVKLSPDSFVDISHVDGYTLAYTLLPVGETRFAKCFGYCAKGADGSWYNPGNHFDQSCCAAGSKDAARCKPFCFGVKTTDAHKLDVSKCPTDDDLSVPPSSGNMKDVNLQYHSRNDPK